MSSDTDPLAEARRRFKALPAPDTTRDAAAAEAIRSAGQLMGRLVADRELARVMKSQGYDAAELRTGVTLQAAAEEVFRSCALSLARVEKLQAGFQDGWVAAREEYVEFRWVVRCQYRDDQARMALQIVGQLADDVPGFLAQATASYRAAQLLPESEPLSRLGFGVERVGAALVQLRRLASLELELYAGRSKAARYLDERDLAIAMLNLWIRDFYRAARMALGESWHAPAATSVVRKRKPRTTRQNRASAHPHVQKRTTWRSSLRRF